ncbi:MAG: MarR family winged helix-turn-helix transcriptional regulator [Chloroflexota bacterium]
MRCSNWHAEAPLALQIVFLGHRLAHLLERRLATRDFTHTQASLIIALSRRSGVMAQDLAEPVHVEPASITRALQALERRGLIDRAPHPTDGRANLFFLTDEGKEAEAALTQMFRETSAEIERGLSPEEAIHFRHALRTVLRRVDELRETVL